jgi:multiple sugar transport system permease protein
MVVTRMHNPTRMPDKPSEKLDVPVRPATSETPTRRARVRGSRGDGRAAALLIAPNLLMFGVFVVAPVLGGLLLSFTTWDITNGFPKWVGLANYQKMFADPLVWQAVGTTLKFIVFGVLPTVAISLGLAMLINFRFRLVAAVRSLYLIPAASPRRTGGPARPGRSPRSTSSPSGSVCRSPPCCTWPRCSASRTP